MVESQDKNKTAKRPKIISAFFIKLSEDFTSLIDFD